MHFCTFVIIPADGDIESLDAHVLAPFDEALEVKPYRRHLEPYEIDRMARHYELNSADLDALAAKMEDWINHPGGVDEHGLYWVSTINPDGQWDWYEIGGRWHGYIRGSTRDVIRAQTLVDSPHLKECLPACLVAGGTWSACERFVPDDKLGHLERKSENQWLAEVQSALRENPVGRVVCVDIHC